MRRPDATSPSAPLLALVNATAEWHAGLPAVCRASVRVLDRVQFTVHRGDCILVHHDDPAGARVLLAALGGHHALPLGRRLHGERHCAPGVRIRRCSVPAEAVGALQSGWTDIDHRSTHAPADPHGHHAVVHLLRGSRSAPLTEDRRREWHGWARNARARGGAIVIVAPAPPQTAAAVPAPSRMVDALREQSAVPYETQASRAVWLRHGRLFNLRTWD